MRATQEIQYLNQSIGFQIAILQIETTKIMKGEGKDVPWTSTHQARQDCQ